MMTQPTLAEVRAKGQPPEVLARLNDVLDKHYSVAPLDGMVTNLPVRVGESAVVGVQNTPGSLLMTIADMSLITAEVKVDETDIVNVHLQQTANSTIDAIPNRTFKGHVIEMGNSVYTTPVVANNTLFIANKDHLFAIASGAKPAADETAAKDD